MLNLKDSPRITVRYFRELLRTHSFEEQRRIFGRHKIPEDKLKYWTYEFVDSFSGQKLFLVVIHLENTPQDELVMIPVIEVETKSEPSYVTVMGGDVIVLSTHFLKRYAQRTGRDFLIPFILGCYFANERRSVLIFEDGESGQVVYGSDSGLSICRKDRGKLFYATFLNLRLLKDGQIKAWYEAYDNGLKRKGSSNISLESIEKSAKLYAEFFENKV